MVNPLNILLEKNVLTGPNYGDWVKRLRAGLRKKSLEHVLEQDGPTFTGAENGTSVLKINKRWNSDAQKVTSYMLKSTSKN